MGTCSQKVALLNIQKTIDREGETERCRQRDGDRGAYEDRERQIKKDRDRRHIKRQSE